GNILVSKDGIPKLLDFGIAKLLDESAQAILQDGAIAHTRVHDRLLTPEYASPEQIRGQPVTTTSDVYALGIVLYELLAGTRPYTVNALNQLELERSICIQDPLKPSQRVSVLARQVLHSASDMITTEVSSSTSSGDTGVSETVATATPLSLIPAARKTSFKKLEHQLKGDLDAIVMKALRKEPEKRYSSVEHLIEDLNRHLNQEPVEARQGNRWYYTQRFIKRHTIGVIAGAAALLALIAVAIILSVQAQHLKQQRDIASQERDKATQESERAETVSNFMLDVFTAADPFQSQDKQITAKELLDKAANKIETTLNDQPEVKARLLEAIGEAYLNQGKINDAIKLLEEALKIKQNSTPNDVLSLVDLNEDIGQAYYAMKDITSTNRYLQQSQTLLENANLTHTQEYLQTLEGRAAVERERYNLPAAEYFFRNALKLSRQLNKADNPIAVSITYQLAQILDWQAKYIEAENLYHQAEKMASDTLPDKHPFRINLKLLLGYHFFLLDKLDQATALIMQALANQRMVLGDDNPQLVRTYAYLSQIQMRRKAWQSAEQNARTALSIASRSSRKRNDYYIGLAHLALSDVLVRLKKFPEAKRESQAALSILTPIEPSENQLTPFANYLLAWAWSGEHHPKQAEILLESNIAKWTSMNASSWLTARSESLLGVALLQLHKPDEAKQHLLHADEILSAKDSGAFPDDAATAHKRVEEFQHCEAEHHLDNCKLTI
ncbi:MAG TPA: tetratricopeptide repeat protein, partial [Steroidobacteraceae bacterium]|nr:tetratricopeptide repeat protein [Steroidobacteraceae bacterium]